MPTLLEIQKRLESKRFPTRLRGMKELLWTGRREEFVDRALVEKDGALVILFLLQ
jgi:hypothetical protein